MVRIKIKAEIMRFLLLLSPFVLCYPLQFKGLGNKGIYSRTGWLYSPQGKYLVTEAGDPNPCCVVQAYQGIFLCQKNWCLFAGITLTFQMTDMSCRELMLKYFDFILF